MCHTPSDMPPTAASHALLRPPLAGAPPDGPPPGPAGPNLTDPCPNHGRYWTHKASESGASCMQITHIARCESSSQWEAKTRDTGAEDNGEDHTLEFHSKTCKNSVTLGRMEDEVG
ncbi:hypothetical protein F511_24816 [Dorcoceras hygrometricum]|uniref:Uncharacterized protein n=1 Tax=Dorcoceras hygrometricum TaxID=472368 RepID=A0A2Z7DEW8_9LAMI|nr:hypothetical protein F511_24816 [Dorcoceras hygrometricum]